MPRPLSPSTTKDALDLLGQLLEAEDKGPFALVVCGGASLQALGLHTRTTKDVDVLALRDVGSRALISPAPMPEELLRAASLVAAELDLPTDWLNNGPSSGPGGLFQMGLPLGLADRLSAQGHGPRLEVAFISRFDQIHLKFYAAVDQPGSYHTADLRHLAPTAPELESAFQWATTHDVSDAFRQLAAGLLKELGHDDIARRV